MTNPQVKEIKINDERGVYWMIAFMKVKVNNERSRIIATNRQRTITWRHKMRIVTVPFIQAGQGLASRLEALVSYPHARWL